jgi:hydrogenase nickel incorporation protein HypA/HybF
MHELSIAQSILDIVRQHVDQQRADDVRSVIVRIGPLSGVVTDSLCFCFGALVDGTPYRRAVLAVERVPILCRCQQCQSRSELFELALHCPVCNSAQIELAGGDDLQLHQIELADDPAEVS